VPAQGDSFVAALPQSLKKRPDARASICIASHFQQSGFAAPGSLNAMANGSGGLAGLKLPQLALVRPQ
jgi:hypothetical protein